MAVMRSRKYAQYSDGDILRLYASDPVGEDLHFLSIEIEQRNLSAQAENSLKAARKKNRHSLLYYLFYVAMSLFFIARFGSDYL